MTMMYDGNDWAWWWMIPMMLVMIVAVAGVVWAVVWAIVRTTAPSGETKKEHEPTPDEILARRLASGEIDADEYHARLDALHHAGRG